MNGNYFTYLMGLIEMDQKEESYYMLLKELDRYAFIPRVLHDENRNTDGLNLRKLYSDYRSMENDYDYYSFDADIKWCNGGSLLDSSNIRVASHCSILEFLIGLSKRMSELISDKKLSDWFWEILENWFWDYRAFSDGHYYSKKNNGDLEVRHRIKILNDRVYTSTGKGGLFPLKHAKKDQREIEIWFQMQNYLLENVSIDDFGNSFEKGE